MTVGKKPPDDNDVIMPKRHLSSLSIINNEEEKMHRKAYQIYFRERKSRGK